MRAWFRDGDVAPEPRGVLENEGGEIELLCPVRTHKYTGDESRGFLTEACLRSFDGYIRVSGRSRLERNFVRLLDKKHAALCRCALLCCCKE